MEIFFSTSTTITGSLAPAVSPPKNLKVINSVAWFTLPSAGAQSLYLINSSIKSKCCFHFCLIVEYRNKSRKFDSPGHQSADHQDFHTMRMPGGETNYNQNNTLVA